MKLTETRQQPPCGHEMPTNCPCFWQPIEDGFHSCDWTHMKGDNQTRTISSVGHCYPYYCCFGFFYYYLSYRLHWFSRGILVIGFKKKLWTGENKTSQSNVRSMILMALGFSLLLVNVKYAYKDSPMATAVIN